MTGAAIISIIISLPIMALGVFFMLCPRALWSVWRNGRSSEPGRFDLAFIRITGAVIAVMGLGLLVITIH